MNNTLIALGSLKDVSTRQHQSLAASFLNVRMIVLCDRSGSMNVHDARGGSARFQIEDELVAKLQREHPGQILLAYFNDSASLLPNGYLPQPSGGTEMLRGLRAIQDYVVGDVKAVLISDGEPCDSETEILQEIQAKWHGKLDAYYAGPEGSDGYKFMQQIAQIANGKCDADVLNANLPKLEQNLKLALQDGR